MKPNNKHVIFFLFFIPALAYGQKTVSVNYHKTSHVIFPDNIVYSSSIEDVVLTNIPDGVKNILQIKANKKNFGETNLSVATLDGKFYDYRLVYTDAKNNTVINETGKTINTEGEIRLNTSSQIHFILPGKIVYVDFGDDGIVARQGENTENIIMLTAGKPDFPETNVSFATAKGEFYTYNVIPGKPEKTVYDFSKNREVLLTEQKKIINKENILDAIYSHKRRIFSIGKNEGKVVLSLNNLFADTDMLYFLFAVENKSSLAYDIKYIKFSVEYEKQSKKTASQDEDLEIVFKDKWDDRIDVKEHNIFLIATPKVTLGERQVLRVYLSENDGGRNFILNIPNSVLTDASYLNYK